MQKNNKKQRVIRMSGTYQSVLLTVGLSEHENDGMRQEFSAELIAIRSADAQGAIRIIENENYYGMLLLNLVPPCTEGWAVLEHLQSSQWLSQYPTLVVTAPEDSAAREKALAMGAYDTILQGCEPFMAMKRIRNALRTVQMDELVKNTLARMRQLERQNETARIAEIDELTGLSTLAAFCRKTGEIIKDRPVGSYVIVRWDIDRFKIYKDIYGTTGGDELLRHIGQCYQQYPEWHSCHAGTDHFIHLVPIALFDEEETRQTIQGWLNASKNKYTFVPRIGVYVVDEPEDDVNIMCDRAQLALLTLKGNYQKNIAFYDNSIREKLREEQELIGDMAVALEEGQFQVYLQPQYNHSNNTIVGAEALVRWFHPTKGLISPGTFIPVFERNGFINKLDTYMWEQVCRLLSEWLRSGRKVVPVSVNVSRVDIADAGLLDTLDALIRKYEIPEELLRLEITESAYMDNPEQLIVMVNHLRDRGFLVEMDDFGSGYSSLNMLKNVPVDVLKLDMKFLSCMDQRSGNILNSVVRMAHWLDLPVIAEGVETVAQADYLHTVGCQVMQGYYYARPMAVDKFEELLDSADVVRPAASLPNTSVEGVMDFIDPDSHQALLFSVFVGGAAIMEYDGVELESLRTNDRFLEELRTTSEAYHTHRKGLLRHVPEGDRQLLLKAMEDAETTGKQQQCEFRVCAVPPGEGYLWLHTHIRFLARNMNHLIYYFDITNTTAQQELLAKYQRLNNEMTSIINNVPGGILHLEMLEDSVRIAYCNDGAAELFDYAQDEFMKRYSEHPGDALHPDDRQKLMPMLRLALEDEHAKPSIRYRTRMKNGGWRWTQMYAQRLNNEQGRQFITAIVISVDEIAQKDLITKDLQRELKKKSDYLQSLYHTVPCAIMRYNVRENGHVDLLRYNEAAWQLLGYDSQLQYNNAIFDGNTLRNTHPEDLQMVRSNVRMILEGQEDSRRFEHRIIREDGSVRWVQVILHRLQYEGEEDSLLCVFTDINDQVKNQTQLYRDALLAYMDELYEVDLVQDTIQVRDHRNMTGDARSFSSFVEQWCMHMVAEEDRSRLKAFFAETGQDESPIRSIRHNIYHISGQQRPAETVMICGEQRRCLLGIKYLNGQYGLTPADELKPGEMVQNPFELMQHGEEETQFGIAAFDYDVSADRLSMSCEAPDGHVFVEVLEGYLNNPIPDKNPLSALEARKCITRALREKGSHCINYGCEIACGQMGWFRLNAFSAPEEDGQIRRVRGVLMNNRQRVERNAIARELASDFGNITSNFQYSLVEMLMKVTAAGCDSTKSTINTIMHNVGSQMGLERLYIVRQEGENCWTTAFEWCKGGVAPQMDRQQQFAFAPSVTVPYYDYFDGNGVLITPRRLTAHPELKELPFAMDATLHVALEYGGTFHGFVGFEFCNAKEIEGTRVGIAIVVAMSLSILMGQRARLKERLQKDLEHKLANQYIQDRYNCIMKQTGVYLLNWNETDNAFGIELFDQSADQLVEETGHRVLDHIHPQDREALITYFQDELWKQNRSLNLRMQMRSGVYRWMRLGSAQPERRTDGKVNIIAALVDMDEAANASEALVESNQRFEDIVNNIPIGIGILEMPVEGSGQYRLVYASDPLCRMFGVERCEFMQAGMLGKLENWMPEWLPADQQIKERLWNGETVYMRKEAKLRNGRTIWLSSACRLLTRKGKHYCYVSVSDITERVEIERKEIWQQERYRLISQIDDVVVFDYSPADDVMTISKNQSGKPPVEEIHPNYLKSLENRAFFVHQDDLVTVRRCLTEACEAPASGTLEFLGRYFCDEYRWQRIRYVSVGDERGRVYRVVGCIEDVNEERILHSQLQQRAQQDGTTGLMNKDTGYLSIETALEELPEDQQDAVLFVDLDNFKHINDTMGHMEGDNVLRQVAECMIALFRQDDILARFGGDEFIVYMRNAQSEESLLKKAATLIESINGITMRDGSRVGCSIGATFAGSRESFTAVFERVDAAVYLAKTAGKNCCRMLKRKAQ